MQQPRALGAVVLVLYIVGIVLGVSEPKPEIHEVIEHDNLLVICNTTVSDDTHIYWTKNDTKTPFFRNGTRLELIDVKRDEAGEYICHSVNTSSVAENGTERNVTVEVVKVDVLYPAEVIECSVTPTTIMSNQTYLVHYNIVGNPAPTWEIRNNRTHDILVQSNKVASGVLGPLDIMCGDDGYIMCTGSNDLNKGQNTSGGGNLTVLCPPVPLPGMQPMYKVVSAPHAYAYLLLNFVGNPVPTVNWSRQDGQPMPWSRIQELDTKYFTFLNISDVQIYDFTNYTLTMTNEFGVNTIQFSVVAWGRPETPTDLQFYDVTEDSVTLRWTSGYDMGSQQHFQVYSMSSGQTISEQIFDTSLNHGINDTFTYVLKGLTSGTFYNLSISSTNKREYTSGFALPYATFTTKSPPTTPSPSGSHTDVYVIVGCVLGSVGLVAAVAVTVYLVRYRRVRSGYDDLKK